MLDTCECEGYALVLCHSICQLGHRNPEEVFRNIVNFLERETTEVVILEFQLHNANVATLSKLHEIISITHGFTDLMYIHQSEKWPQLGDLVRSNKVRALVACRANTHNKPYNF